MFMAEREKMHDACVREVYVSVKEEEKSNLAIWNRCMGVNLSFRWGSMKTSPHVIFPFTTVCPATSYCRRVISLPVLRNCYKLYSNYNKVNILSQQSISPIDNNGKKKFF